MSQKQARYLGIIAVMAVLGTVSGCSRGIKEGLYTLKGSSGKTLLIKGDEELMGSLASRYGSFTVEPFDNEVGEICPPEFLSALSEQLNKRLQYPPKSFSDRLKGKDSEEMGPLFTGPANRTLRVTGRVIQYEQQEILDKAASPMDEAICRVKFIDGDSGQVLAEANCTGRAKSSIRTGPEELAKGVAKAVQKLLKPDD
jgi:hypothetical protein